MVINVNAAGTIAGKVTILKGQVFIERGGQKIQVKKDDTILESDIIESETGTARITMIDSNLVDVYPRSKVEIAKYVYKPNEDQKEVELKVDFGKIKSTVNQKYDGAKNKFQVKTPSAVAGVRGTVFTAEYDRIKKTSRVVTIEGLVAVSKILDRKKQAPTVFVRPDQIVKVDPEQLNVEQPRDLKPEERDELKKEDKDLGFQYDPKKEQPAGASNGPAKGIKETIKTAVNSSGKREQFQQQTQERRQKQLEEEQSKKQKQAEVAHAKKQAIEEAQKKIELARRLAEMAKRESIIRPPSGTDGSVPTPPPTNSPPYGH